MKFKYFGDVQCQVIGRDTEFVVNGLEQKGTVAILAFVQIYMDPSLYLSRTGCLVHYPIYHFTWVNWKVRMNYN